MPLYFFPAYLTLVMRCGIRKMIEVGSFVVGFTESNVLLFVNLPTSLVVLHTYNLHNAAVARLSWNIAHWRSAAAYWQYLSATGVQLVAGANGAYILLYLPKLSTR